MDSTAPDLITAFLTGAAVMGLLVLAIWLRRKGGRP
jgi:hypothetical protein